MADNTAQNGTALIATDETTQLNGATVPAVQVQLIKPVFGGDGVSQFVTPTNGLPVDVKASVLATGATTETTLQGVRTDLGTDGATPPAILGTGTGVRGWLRSIYEKLTGTIAVTGTFFQATQPVSIAASVAVTGALTDTQIRATALPVSGTFFQASQPVSLATNTPDVTDRAGRLLGSIANTGFTVTGNSLVSTANSTTVALAANATFTGTSEDVSEYSTVMVTVFADQASATDGLSMQFSSNGTNWDLVDVYSIPINNGKVFSVGVEAKFFRIVYTNGATASTVLRLQTLYSKASKIASSVRPQDARPNDNDFEEVLSFGMVYNGTTWDRLRGTIANGLAVDVTRISDLRAATLHVTATAAVNTAITASLPAPAAGLFHYITSVQLVKLYSVLGVASGAGVVITSSNLPGSPTWLTEQAAGAVGTAVRVIDYQPTTPLKATLAATATTFVAPAQLQTIWRWNVSYFTAA